MGAEWSGKARPLRQEARLFWEWRAAAVILSARFSALFCLFLHSWPSILSPTLHNALRSCGTKDVLKDVCCCPAASLGPATRNLLAVDQGPVTHPFAAACRSGSERLPLLKLRFFFFLTIILIQPFVLFVHPSAHVELSPSLHSEPQPPP